MPIGVVTGDAVNTASRLQAAAEPGTVIVGASTYASTRDVVDYLELESLELRNTAISDGGVRYLMSLAKLQRLILAMTHVSPAGIYELKQSLPELKASLHDGYAP